MIQNTDFKSPDQEKQVVNELLKRQNALLGQSLINLDHFLYLHKSISRLNLKDIQEALIDKLPHILSIRWFTLFLYNPAKKSLELTCHNHPDLPEELVLSLQESQVMQEALSQGRYILEPDFTKSRYFRGKRNPLFRNNFFVCIPLMIENQIIGVINLNDNEKGSFSVNDLDYVLNVMEFVSLSVSNALLYEKTQLLSVTDGLTMLNNHQQMQKILKSEFERSRRYASPLSVVMMDVDHFKEINDTHGHQAGDEILVELAGVISRICRANDSAARYGGEEFLLILPETHLQGAELIAERIRKEIAGQTFASNGDRFRVTISCGVAELDLASMKSAADLIHVVDRAMYRAKRQGRNRTCLGGPDDLA